MIIKWYNRDNISDVEMKQARIVAERLSGRKKDIPDSTWEDFMKFEDIKIGSAIDPVLTELASNLHRNIEKFLEGMEE